MNEVTQLLLGNGVQIPCPELTCIEPNVNPERFEPGCWIGPGSRISGPETLVRRGARIGTEGPAFVTDCAVGEDVVLASGSFSQSVFLHHAAVGPSAHVRFGTLLDEHASVAHCVGLKQTILLPWATLGSLINFCDALLAGGRSAADHSEVGSGFIHFNFTPHGDKATPSLFGNAREGAWMRESRVFLGGAGGVVGPVSIGFGTVLAAGSVYRKDRGPGLLVYAEPLPAVTRSFDPTEIRGVRARVRRNLAYLAELAALFAFYRDARSLLVRGDRFGEWLNQATLTLLSRSATERVKQLAKFAHMANHESKGVEGKCAATLEATLKHDGSEFTNLALAADAVDTEARDRVVAVLAPRKSWCQTASGLSDDVVMAGKKWLGGVAECYVRSPAVAAIMKELD